MINIHSDIYAEKALELVRQGKCFFITGKAGTGKTTLLRRIVADCQGKKNVVVVAPTGVAARNANGVTIHSFLRLPLTPYLPGVKNPKLYRLNKAEQKVVESVQLIIIDEISMVRCDILDAMDDVLRHYRKNDRPFGGVQMVMFGDLYQLMPVVKESDKQKLNEHYRTPYFFSSKIIEKVNCKVLELQNVYRQNNVNFINLLNHVRAGAVDSRDLRSLQGRYRKDFVPNDKEGYIRITTHNRRAERYNEERLQELRGAAYDYKAIIIDNYPKDEWPTDYVLQFKVGARVMFIRNDNAMGRYVNGTLGTVVGLDDDSIKVKTDEGMVVNVEKQTWEYIRYRINKETRVLEEYVCGTYIQYPLKLAWAITIHKSQGLTFDKVVIDAGRAFTSGQVYVALSRCRRFDTIVLASQITEKAIKTDPDVKAYFDKVRRHDVHPEPTQHVFDIRIGSLDTFEKILAGIKTDIGRIINSVSIAKELLSGGYGESLIAKSEVCPYIPKRFTHINFVHENRKVCVAITNISFLLQSTDNGCYWYIKYAFRNM